MPGIGPFEWDEAKSAANLHVHGIDFREVLRFDWDSAQLTNDTRREYGEARIIAVGRIGPRVFCATRGADQDHLATKGKQQGDQAI